MNDNFNTLPDNLRKYFWDCDFEELHWDKYYWFITERLLNFGNQKAIKWLTQHIEIAPLKKIVSESRQLNDKTKNFWEIIMKEYND